MGDKLQHRPIKSDRPQIARYSVLSLGKHGLHTTSRMAAGIGLAAILIAVIAAVTSGTTEAPTSNIPLSDKSSQITGNTQQTTSNASSQTTPSSTSTDISQNQASSSPATGNQQAAVSINGISLPIPSSGDTNQTVSIPGGQATVNVNRSGSTSTTIVNSTTTQSSSNSSTSVDLYSSSQ